MNQQYEQLRVQEGEYIPQPALDYPQDNPFARTLFPKYTKELTIDDKYPYLDDSIGNKLNLFLGYYVFLHILLRIKLRVQMGLRIRGREVLKKHKKGFKNGAITIANHVYRLDCPCVLIAVNSIHTTRIPMFAPNFRTKDGYFMRIAGGIPIPEAEALSVVVVVVLVVLVFVLGGLTGLLT